MKKRILFVIINTAFLLGFVSCGEKSKEDDTNRSSNGNCGTQTVSDYNSVVLACKYMFSRDDITKCENNILEFKSKYAGINCSAVTGYGLNEETFQITESYFNEILVEVQNL